MTQLQLPIVEGVASKIDRILARCGDRVKRGSVYFDEKGEAEAKAIAARDARDDASRDVAGMPKRLSVWRPVCRN